MLNKRRVAAVIAVAGLASLPAGLAWKAEQQIRAEVAATNEVLSAQKVPLQVELKHYERGYLHSTGVYRLNWLDGETREVVGCVDLASDMTHTPLQFFKGFWVEARSTLIADDAKSDCAFAQLIRNTPAGQALYEKFGSEGPVEILSSIAVSGRLHDQVRSQAFLLSGGQEETAWELAVEPLDLEVATDLEGLFLEISGTWKGLRFRKGDEALSLGGLTIRTAQRKALEALDMGEMHLDLTDIRATSASKAFPGFVADRFTVGTLTDLRHGRLVTTTEMVAAGLEVGDVGLGDWRMRVSLEDLDPRAANALALQFRTLNPDTGLPAEWDTAEGKAQANRSLQELLRRSVLKVDPVQVNLEGETGELKASFRPVNVEALDLDRLQQQPMFVMGLFEGEAELVFGQAFARKFGVLPLRLKAQEAGVTPEQMSAMVVQQTLQTDSMLDNFVAQGMLTRDDSSGLYHLKLTYAKGEPRINGQPLR